MARAENHWRGQLAHLLPHLILGHFLFFKFSTALPDSERRVIEVEHARVIEVNDF